MNLLGAGQFYDKISSDYDRMTGLDQRFAREKKTLTAWHKKYGFYRVLDAACGSGIHTLALKSLGIHALGADISQKMIRKARENAKKLGSDCHFEQADLLRLPEKVSGRYDALFVLGNSLPHIQSQSELRQILLGLKQVLDLKGLLVFQLLNYIPILKNKERIVSITRSEDNQYIRFYDFYPDHLVFNLLIINSQTGSNSHQLFATKLIPYLYPDIERVLSQTGYRIRDVYGSMDFDPFHEKTSKNLIIVAELLV